MPIPYYDAADGRLLNMLSESEAQRYAADGTAHAIRSRAGRIVRLYGITRERVFDSVAMLHGAASQFTQRVRDEDGVIIAPNPIREHQERAKMWPHGRRVHPVDGGTWWISEPLPAVSTGGGAVRPPLATK